MGWNFRKSVNLGGGIRLNFSKSGIGISGGFKGFRVSKGSKGTRVHASIPSTGIFYTENLSGKRKKSSSKRKAPNNHNNTNQDVNAASAVGAMNSSGGYQYTERVTNTYTGETRELRAHTQFELNQLVQIEQARQGVNEQRQRQLDAAKDVQTQVIIMNTQLQSSQKELKGLINDTLSVNDRIDWDSEMIMEEYPPMDFKEEPPSTYKEYKLGFFRSLFINDKKFELPDLETAEMRDYEKRRNAAIVEYLKKKTEYDTLRNKKNGEMLYLKNRFESSNKDAIERYISIVLTKSEYPADFEHDFDVEYNKNSKTAIINFLFQDIDSFPIIKKYVYNREKMIIEELAMRKDEAVAFYSEVLYSVGIRTIHEVFESVYTDSVDIVCFNGYIEEPDQSGKNQCAFAMRSSRAKFETIDLTQPLGSVISEIESRTIRDFTGYEQVTPFE